MHASLKLAAIFVAALVLPRAEAQQRPSAALQLKSFEFLGCGGDYSGGPSVRRLTSNGNVTFLVRHSDTCGLEGRNPKATWDSGTLDLAYELYSPSEGVMMCDCEYWAKFTFGPAAMLLRGVTFGGQEPELLGEWPSGR